MNFTKFKTYFSQQNAEYIMLTILTIFMYIFIKSRIMEAVYVYLLTKTFSDENVYDKPFKTFILESIKLSNNIYQYYINYTEPTNVIDLSLPGNSKEKPIDLTESKVNEDDNMEVDDLIKSSEVAHKNEDNGVSTTGRFESPQIPWTGNSEWENKKKE